MSTDAVREVLETTLRNELGTALPGIPVRFENTRFEQPKGEPWMYVTIIDNLAKRAQVGSPKQFKLCGVVNVQCMVPENTGTKVIKQMADAVFTILADRQFPFPAGGLRTYGVDRRTRAVVNGWFPVTVQAEYEARVTLQRDDA